MRVKGRAPHRRSLARASLSALVVAALGLALTVWIGSYFFSLQWVIDKHLAVTVRYTSITVLRGRDDPASGTSFSMTTGFNFGRAALRHAEWWFTTENTPFYRSLRAPLWVFAVPPAVAAAWLMRDGRRAPLTCPRCGYSRRGLPPLTPCPECGDPDPGIIAQAPPGPPGN